MKCITAIIFLFLSVYSFADAPGNEGRPSYDVKVTGLNNYTGYSFYYIPAYGEQKKLEDSAEVHVEGGYGEPKCSVIWAVNDKTDIHTDTIYFCSGDEEPRAIRVNISDNHLAYDADKEIKKENSVPFSAGNISTDNTSGKNRNIMYFISGLSLVILLGLVLMIWKKNRNIKQQVL